MRFKINIMKKHYYLFILITSTLFSQQSWVETNIPNSMSRYDDVFFLNENLGWAANGYGASVYKTTNGGNTWTLQHIVNGNYFRNIEFLDENIGFLGTLLGSFYKTIDGGTTWQAVTTLPFTNIAICGLDTVGSNTVYGCGAYFEPAYIIKSTDSGTTWQYIDMSEHAIALVEVLFTTENIGYVSGKNENGGIILKTIDGGITWQTIYNGSIPGEYVWKLQILESNPNIIFGSVESISPLNGKLIKSIDAGVNWISKEVPDTDIQAVGFLDENHGWMGGHHTGFLETFDSGTTWVDTGIGFSLNRIFFVNQNIVYTSGYSIYKMTDNLSNPNYNQTENNFLNIKVAPNPIKDILNIEIDFLNPDNLFIELYSGEGKFITKLSRESGIQKGLKKYSFDFPYQSGVYFLNFHSNSGRQSVKIIK